KLVLLASAVLAAAALGGFMAAHSFAGAAMAGVALGVGGGGLNIATNALVSDIYGDDRGPMLNYLGMFYGIGALFVPLLVATISATLPPQQIIGCALALAGICAAAYAGMQFPPPRDARRFTLGDAPRVAARAGVV